MTEELERLNKILKAKDECIHILSKSSNNFCKRIVKAKNLINTYSKYIPEDLRDDLLNILDGVEYEI